MKRFAETIQSASRFIASPCWAVFASWMLIASVVAQQDIPDELKASLGQINERSVMSTVSFLASDEMAGRDTPSREFDIACAYVASRFRGAGLQGGGDQGSFYQVSEIATVQLPTTGLSVRVGDQSVDSFGMLAGESESASISGDLTVVDWADNATPQLAGPVYLPMDNFDRRRDMFNLVRKTLQLKRSGATAILLGVSENHPLVTEARLRQSERLVSTRGDFAGPTLLIPKLTAEQLKQPIRLEVPGVRGGKSKVRNVIGVLPGSDPTLAAQAVIFSAHLDHIGQSSDGIFNGADDNASGVTAVLTLADAYASLPTRPKRTTIFMTFWGEERGLLGSRYYVSRPTWPLEKVVANINIEMIGRPEAGAREKVWMTGWQHSNLGELMDRGSSQVGVTTFEHLQYSQQLYRASDNYSFVEKGLIAHSFSAGSLHGDYHQVTDVWERLDIPHATRVVEGLFMGSLPIANGELTPEIKK